MIFGGARYNSTYQSCLCQATYKHVLPMPSHHIQNEFWRGKVLQYYHVLLPRATSTIRIEFWRGKVVQYHHVLLPRVTSTPTTRRRHDTTTATTLATSSRRCLRFLWDTEQPAAILHATAATVKRPVPDGEVSSYSPKERRWFLRRQLQERKNQHSLHIGRRR